MVEVSVTATQTRLRAVPPLRVYDLLGLHFRIQFFDQVREHCCVLGRRGEETLEYTPCITADIPGD